MTVFVILYIDGYYADAIQGDVFYSSKEKAEEARRKIYDAEQGWLTCGDDGVYFYKKDPYEEWCSDMEIQEWRVV